MDNPYWPPELAAHAGKLPHEHYVVLLPLALSRTQDDKGRVRWTFFGSSEQGPSWAFWKGFHSGPTEELPEERGIDFFRRLLVAVSRELAREMVRSAQGGLSFPPLRREPSSSGLAMA